MDGLHVRRINKAHFRYSSAFHFYAMAALLLLKQRQSIKNIKRRFFMGSIIKKPKAPVIKRVAPRAQTPVTPTVVEPTETKKTDEEISADARTQSLLRRSRGRFGTIATSFRGFLNSSDNNTQRKTLLGE
jgi:hypothetical protein